MLNACVSKSSIAISGKFRDIIHYKDGRVVDKGWDSNLIVNNLTVLTACLMKGQVGYSRLLYWAVGIGESNWDIPPLPEIDQLDIISGASVTSTLTVTLNGVNFIISVTSGDTPAQVATKIRAAVYAGWTTGGSSSTITFTSNVTGHKSDIQFSAGTTGVLATPSVIQDGTAGNPRPSPQRSDTRLVNEIFRKEIQLSDIVFLTEAGEVSEEPTNIIEISVIFGELEAIGGWREFAIFGGDATSDPNSGININYKTHGLIDKSEEGTSIERKIVFEFVLAEV